jgi:hypothetical protein
MFASAPPKLPVTLIPGVIQVKSFVFTEEANFSEIGGCPDGHCFGKFRPCT